MNVVKRPYIESEHEDCRSASGILLVGGLGIGLMIGLISGAFLGSFSENQRMQAIAVSVGAGEYNRTTGIFEFVLPRPNHEGLPQHEAN